MVKALHRAGIEVILDVVYNHTAEGNHLGPMLSFKGVDNQSYYRLMPDDPRFYMDFTGTGNSLNPVHPSVLRLIMDSLRYWVIECHVDGFRFDLASALARELYDVDRLSAFFDIIHQDPVLSQVKLIAEPWDVGPGRLPGGQLPGAVVGVERDLPRHDARLLARAGARSATSPRASPARPTSTRPTAATPFASINFITAHDGFTLRDLVSYNEKHNEANLRGQPRRHRRQPLLELRRRGADRRSGDQSTCAPASSATSSPTLLLSQGVPMLLGGDEMCRTQDGNNNAWCQDNELSWFDWDRRGRDGELLDFTRRLIRAAARAPGVAPRATSCAASEPKGSGLPDVWWFRPDGRRMTRRDWQTGARVLGVFLNGKEITTPGPRRRGRSPTTRSWCSSTPTPRTASSSCPTAASAPLGRSS